MQQLLPIGEAVLAGALDSVENILINTVGRLRPHGASSNRRPDSHCLDGQLAIVTGANAGIGYATAQQLVERGAHVVLACRSRERGEAAAAELAARAPLPGCGPGSVEFAPLDLGSLASVRRFARDFNRSGRRLDVLVCNAGIMSPPARLVSEDNLELQFQVNFLSHFLLAHQLLAEQRRRRAKQAQKDNKHKGRQQQAVVVAAQACSPAAAPSGAGSGACSSAPGGGGGTRLVLLSSLTHPAGRVKWADKQSAASYSPFTSYALSKLANTMLAGEWQRRFDRSGREFGADSAVAIHPGIVATSLATNFFDSTSAAALPGLQAVVRPVLSALYPLLLRTPESSADSMMVAITSPSARVAGRYLHNSRVARPTRFAEDPERAAELWDLAVELSGLGTCDASLA